MKCLHYRKILLCGLLAFIYSSALLAQTTTHLDPGFEPIFNGENLNGWFTSQDAGGIEVKNEVLTIKGEGGPEIIHALNKLGNFVFRFDFQISENGDSGVLIRYNKKHPESSGIEIQLGLSENETYGSGAIFNMVQAINSPDEKEEVWHTMEIVCDRKQIIVAVNGEITTWVHYDHSSGLASRQMEGMLGFQRNYSGNKPWLKLKNLRIKNLDKDAQYVLDGFTYTDGKVRKQAHERAVRLKSGIIKKLCANLGNKDLRVASGSKKALREIIARASDPEIEPSQRESILETLNEYQSEGQNKYAKQFIEEQLKLLQAN